MNDRSRLLIVDDEGSIREVLNRTFSAEGYDCEEAGCVDEALEKIKASPPQLILSDIMMPGRSGVELLQEIRESDPDTAVIMVTAVADTQTAIEAMKMGAYDYVTKPFNLSEVLMSVERALEKRSLLIANREYRTHLEEKVQQQTSQIRETFLGAVKALAEALEAKDPYTNGHTMRVTELTVTLARGMNLEQQIMEKIKLASQVHDIGKIGIPEEILHKSDKLTDEEFDMIKKHPTMGEKILRPVIKDQTVLKIVRFHHERYSGGGYPSGLAGKEIPIGARILSVADSYDAMTSNRPYRRALTPETARKQLLSNRGSQFDPEVVDLFISIEDMMPFCPMTARPASCHSEIK